MKMHELDFTASTEKQAVHLNWCNRNAPSSANKMQIICAVGKPNDVISFSQNGYC